MNRKKLKVTMKLFCKVLRPNIITNKGSLALTVFVQVSKKIICVQFPLANFMIESVFSIFLTNPNLQRQGSL